MSLNTLSLAGNYDVIFKLFPPREILVNDIPVRDGNIVKLFFTVYGPVRNGFDAGRSNTRASGMGLSEHSNISIPRR
jgi:hypothetical protein